MRSLGLATAALLSLSASPAAAAIGPDCANGPLKSNKICDVTAQPSERAAALVAAMQAQEKLDNLMSKSKGVTRLGLPAYNWWGEALHGVGDAPGLDFKAPFTSATSFPMPILMAAAFDDDLIFKIATIIGTEARAFGNAGIAPLDFWTPNVNPFRDPRWGRGSETPGEDPVRLKGYAKHLIAGLEGNKTQRRIIATCKHYAGNDFEKVGNIDRHNFNAKISLQDLAEYYMQPFQQCARDSKVGSFMCAYNAVNGVPSCASTYLLQTILREHWGWTEHNNYITSDCEAVLDVSQNHHYAKTNAEGTAMTFNAGMDTSCEYSGSSDIPGAWSSGALNITTVDRALKRLYEGLVRAGYFDGNKSEWAALGINDVNTDEGKRLAHQSAVDGTVMLKNDHTLPLPLTSGSKVALVGFWANDSDKLQGGYSGNAPFLHSPVYAAEKLGLTVKTASGPILQNDTAQDTWTNSAVSAAQGSDYILYFGGLDTSAAAEGFDRVSLAWPAAQIKLITKLATLGKPLVIVQMGDLMDNTPLLQLKGVNSILWVSWPGQDGGPAVMDIISGAKSVAGRLPVTMYPANYTALPLTDMNLRPGGSNPGRTYRWFSSPVHAFGFGLHYVNFTAEFGGSAATTYSIQDLVAGCNGPEHPDTCSIAPIPVAVSNKGNRTSDFVALAFVKSETGPKPYPLKTLISYARLRDIGGGQKKEAELPLTLGSLARYDEKGNQILYPGDYTIMLDEPPQASIKLTLTGSEAVLDKWPAP